jgi:predicted deacetylase
MQPNFETMTNKELIAYALAHRENMEPLRVLYSRRTPDSEATWYGSMVTKEGVPIEENIRIAEEAIKQRIEQSNQRNKDARS